MRTPRIFVDIELNAHTCVALPKAARRHVRTVLKRKTGQSLILFNGHGGEYSASIRSASSDAVMVELHEQHHTHGELICAVSLWQTVCRGGRMDYLIEKATELGVRQIVPVMSRRSVVVLKDKRAEQRRGHWQGIAQAASEQSGRTWVPQVLAPTRLQDCLSRTAHSGPDNRASHLLLSPRCDLSLSAHLGLQPGNTNPITLPPALTIIVGPEGGFEPEEYGAMTAQNCLPVSLGALVLRSDTAALAALAMLRLLDDLHRTAHSES